MSEEQNTEDHPVINIDGKDLKVVGEESDVSRFNVGDYVQVHLEMKGQVFLDYPHGDRGVVVALNHKDEEYFYHMPVIQFENELRMFNPDHIFVVQRHDGSPGEVERMEAAEAATEKERAKQEAEANSQDDD